LARVGAFGRGAETVVDGDGLKVTPNNHVVCLQRRWFRFFPACIVPPVHRHLGVDGRHETAIEKSTSA
jgi:hypothetical protein